jgi:hypothetical protein
MRESFTSFSLQKSTQKEISCLGVGITLPFRHRLPSDKTAPPNVVLKDSLVDIIDGGIIQLQDQKTNVGTVTTEKLVPQLS